MSFSPTSRQVVLHETFDESSEPTEEEIREYARKIGIYEENEALFALARDCLMQPLPSDWSPCCDAEYPDRIYYFNFKTKRAQWIHPLEEVHRELVLKARAEHNSNLSISDLADEDSRTTVKEDLKSYEEAPTTISDSQRSKMIPKPRLLEPLTLKPSKGALRKPPDTLDLLKMAAPASAAEMKKVSFDECEVKKRPNSSDIRNRRNIGPMEFRHLSKQEIMTTKSPWRDEGYATESSLTQPPQPHQLTLSGGGAMFLKKMGTKTMIEPTFKSAIPEKDHLGGDLHSAHDKNSISLTLEKELKLNFEVPPPSGQRVPENPSSEVKQIEIDFDDLNIDLNTIVPKDRTLLDRNASSKDTDKSSRNFKKSISIVLNGLTHPDSSQEDKKSDNLIDWTDESVSTAESDKVEMRPQSPPILLKLDSLLRDNLTQPSGNYGSKIPKENVSEKNDRMTLEFDEDGEKGVQKYKPLKESNLELTAVEENEQKHSTAADKSIDVPSLQEAYNVGDSEILGTKSKSEEGKDGEDLMERTKLSLETAKAEKLKALEGDFNVWVKNTEKMFREKEKQFYCNMLERHEDWRKNEENGMIKGIGEKCAEELQNKVKTLRNELLRDEQEALEALRVTLTSQTRERLRVLREDIEACEEREMAELRKNLGEELCKRKEELTRKHRDEMTRLERSLEAMLAEQRKQREHELEKAREDESALAAMRAQLKDAFLEQKTILQQEHEMALQKLRQQHEIELFQVAKTKPTPPGPTSGSDDARTLGKESDPRVYEKLRCEKRLLEDKYKGLKEKYIRLKTDVKLTLEKKIKKKELTSQETDRSQKLVKATEDLDSPNVKRKTQQSEKIKAKKVNNVDSVNQNDETDSSKSKSNPKNVQAELSPEWRSRLEGVEGSSGDEVDYNARVLTRKRSQFFSRLKAASTSILNAPHLNQVDPLSPVENLRRQLKKLEDLEDQFPVTPHTDQYLRYPFSDAPSPHFGSSEFEFFKHRIHLERDSVRRAKEFLKAQKKCYENRQRELQNRLMEGGPSSKSIIDKIHQEERELTEMEVSVHRTRALLGEKIIRLRHLEQSLRRAAPVDRKCALTAPRSLSREDATLSDLSSHSDSSGFSSTHHTSEPVGPRMVLDKNKRHLHSSMQESNEIIQSLENLNSEIRGIWEVLKQSSGPGAVQLPPPPLAWPAVRTNPTATLISPRPLTQMKTQVSSVGHVTVIDSSLVDRTKSLRDWLKSARRSPNPETGGSEKVTL